MDDEPNFLKKSKNFLEKKDDRLDIETATSAEEGLDLLQEKDYDAVISDYKMPGMDGLKFLETVRKERNSEIPFIIFTGKGREEVAIEALNLGANRYFQKGRDPRVQYGVLADVIVREVERLRAEKKRVRAREELRALFNTLPNIACLISPDFEFIRINEKGAEVLGLDREEIIGSRCYRVVHDRDEPIDECPCEKVLETGKPVVDEDFEQEGRNYTTSASPVLNEDGEVEACSLIVKDITERKKVERELRESEERLSAIYKSSPITITLSSLEDGRYIEVNEAFTRLTGWEREEAIGKTAFDLGIYAEPAEKQREELVNELKKEGSVKDWELRFRDRSGEESVGLLSAEIIRIGEKQCMLATVIDITERKRAEKKARKEKERYEELFEGANHLIVTTNKMGYVRQANNWVEKDLGYCREDLKGKPLKEIIHPEDRDRAMECWRKLANGKEVEYELRMLSDDGETVHVTGGGTPIKRDGKVEEIQYNAQDITDRIEAEERARLERKRFEDLFEGANEGIITTDKEGYIKRINKRGEEIGGYSEEEVAGSSVLMFAPSDEREKYIEFWKRILDGEEPVYELKISTKDGRTRHVRSAGRPIKEDGEIVEIQYNYQDITKRVKSEEREKFLHSLLRHDVKNKTLVVEGYLDLLLEADLSGGYEEYIEKAIKATERSIDLIEKVRTLREIEGEETKEIDLEPLIHEAVESCKSETSEMKFQIEMDCPVDGCKVEGGPLLEELFSNLLENSVRHSGGSTVRVSNGETDEEIICVVEDDGKGLPDGEEEKIFEKGYKKGKKAGSGLGMYLVKEIAESYGGGVKAEGSELGGARFKVHLQKA